MGTAVSDSYSRIITDNLAQLYDKSLEGLDRALPGIREGDHFIFEAFGERCRIQPQGITLGENKEDGVVGIILSLYALHARPDVCILEPFRAFRDLPNSMPFVGAFATLAEASLVENVAAIRAARPQIMQRLNGQEPPSAVGGDHALVLYPLPKIALCYIFYEADDEFDATATCLFSSNAHRFLPIDPLADTAEYTAKKIISLL